MDKYSMWNYARMFYSSKNNIFAKSHFLKRKLKFTFIFKQLSLSRTMHRIQNK